MISPFPSSLPPTTHLFLLQFASLPPRTMTARPTRSASPTRSTRPSRSSSQPSPATDTASHITPIFWQRSLVAPNITSIVTLIHTHISAYFPAGMNTSPMLYSSLCSNYLCYYMKCRLRKKKLFMKCHKVLKKPQLISCCNDLVKCYHSSLSAY